MKNSDYGIATIAAKVGYHNSRHFAKLFKNAYGMGPREYRKAHGIKVLASPLVMALIGQIFSAFKIGFKGIDSRFESLG